MANNEMSGYGPPEGPSWPLLQHQSLFCVLLWIIFCAALISKNLETPSAAKLIMGIKTQFNSPLKASPPLKRFARMLDSNKFRFEVPFHQLLGQQR